MYSTYVISSINRKYIYIGISSNVEKRFYQHQNGDNKTTRAYAPFNLLYSEEFNSRVDARKREKYLKSGVGREWIKANYRYQARVAKLVDAHA